MQHPFIPIAPSQTVTVGVASAATALNNSSSVIRHSLEVQNAGTAVVFIEFGFGSGVTAAVATSYPILPSQRKVITIPNGVTHIGTISGSAAQTLYLTVGQGF